MIVANFVRSTLITASRDWLYLGIMLFSLAAISLSMFLGNTAVTEQGFMSTAFIGGSVRMITIIGLILFVCFHVRRSFDSKEIELLLTRPISRIQFVASYFMGFAALTLSLIVPIVIGIYLLSIVGLIWVNQWGIFYWALSFYFETLIILSFAFFISLILNSAVVSVLSTFAFYFIARIMGFFLVSMNNPVSTMHSESLGRFSEKILAVISVFLPRLDMFTKGDWLVYGIVDYNQYWVFIGTAFIYIPLLLVMCVFDFIRKEF